MIILDGRRLWGDHRDEGVVPTVDLRPAERLHPQAAIELVHVLDPVGHLGSELDRWDRVVEREAVAGGPCHRRNPVPHDERPKLWNSPTGASNTTRCLRLRVYLSRPSARCIVPDRNPKVSGTTRYSTDPSMTDVDVLMVMLFPTALAERVRAA